MYVKKYIKGKPINSCKQALRLIMNKSVIFHNHKPQTYGWTQNWSLSMILRLVSLRQLFIAKENPKWLKK